MNRSKFLLLITLTLACIVMPLQAQDVASLELVSELRLPGVVNQLGPITNITARALDIWVEDSLAIVTAGPVVHLVNLNDQSNPETISTIELEDGELSWDAKLSNGFAYLAMQSSNDDSTLRIYDVGNPAQPVLVNNYINDTFAGAHNVFVAGNVAFIASFSASGGPDSNPAPIDAGIWMLDISDPANPQDIGQLLDNNDDPIPSVHDLTVVGNRAYIAGWNTGFWVVDFENLDNPSQLSYTIAGNHVYRPFASRSPSTHNVWPSENGNLLWTTDEVIGEQVRVFDISDLDNVLDLGGFRLRGTPIPHNVMVDGEFAYVSHYLDGLQVFRYDAELMEVIRVAEFQSAASIPRGNPFLGAFGIFVLENHVLIGDTSRGLIVVEKGELLNQTSE